MLTERNILFTEPPTTLNNYLVSKTYLEYAAFLLSDIEYFLIYSDVATKASRFSHVQIRFSEITSLLNKSRNHYLSTNTAFHKPFKLHYDYLNWFYDETLKEFNKSFEVKDESDIMDADTLDVISFSMRFFDAFQAYLPTDHYEFFLYEAAKLSSQAFTDCFKAGQSFLAGNGELSTEFTESALDMLEKSYQALDRDPYRRQEYDALTISLDKRRQEHMSFEHYQSLQKIFIASSYQENVLMKRLFQITSILIDDSISCEMLDELSEVSEYITEKIPDYVATRNESALLMCTSTLITAGQRISDLDLLFPPKEFSMILKSNSYNYLQNLPVRVGN